MTEVGGEVSVGEYLDRLGTVFTTFGTQDSGHVSHGVVDAAGRRRFVKTAGSRGVGADGRTHAERVAALRHAAAVQHDVRHRALVPIEAVVTASDGVLVVHDWFPGELLRSPAELRDDPAEPGPRFRARPQAEIVAALDDVIDLHVDLERAGWIAGDFYDGSLMYDFAARRIAVIDLECYHRGAFANDVGRLPGSTRFMAPEELVVGARIDARTTVFNLARMIETYLGVWGSAVLRDLVACATDPQPDRRPGSVAALLGQWRTVCSPDL